MTSVAFGMIPEKTVHNVLPRILQMCGEEWMAVIRSIDSTILPNDIAKSLAYHGVVSTVMNENICLSMRRIQEALATEVFTGFDELWVLSGPSPPFDLRRLPSATSDATDFSLGMPYGLSDAMEVTNCMLIIGDGCGLNYATTNETILEEIIKGDET